MNYTFNLKHRYQEKHAISTISLSTVNDKNYDNQHVHDFIAKLAKKHYILLEYFSSKNPKLVSHPAPFIGATKSFYGSFPAKTEDANNTESNKK